MTTETQAAAGSIVLVTTADTDILTAERALVGMPWGDAVTVHAFNPVALEGESDEAASARRELLEAVDADVRGRAPTSGRHAGLGRRVRSPVGNLPA